MKKQKDDMQVNVAGLRRNIKNLAHNYSDAQVKVREATSNDPWGPSATIMAELADLTYNVVAFSEIMQMIWKRLNDHGKNWRHVYKALILLEYLIKTGTEKVAQQCKENIFAIQTLREFVYFEEGKDQGTHVREKAKQLVNLLKDDERLKNERTKALKAKERFALHPSGFGSDGYIDGPSHRDMPPGWQEEPKPASDLEMVRPQTAGEEELQLQLAMAMSREEAEQEEAKRRSDDVRLQLALSQSEQDFNREQCTKPHKREEPQSHLLDLLDISLGATSISSPPLGAAGGTGTDPWGTSGRAASQLSDPWSGASSPPIDPWQPNALRSQTSSAPLGAMGGIGNTTNGDAWALRTQSPSVASGSSTEGWLQNNGTLNGNAHPVNSVGDPWITKTTMGAQAAMPPSAAAIGNSSGDPWLTDSTNPEKAHGSTDPWAPKAGNVDGPWWHTEIAKVKASPDMDEFDIITKRNKTGDLLINNSNNNNSSLLDEMDPLSSSNTSYSAASATNMKKPLKTPQAFLGENSSLVNLDNLIKPVVPQTGGSVAYNPFSDTIIPPKTNLFQQQQPAVPSINQLKQQQPFAMTINQDPWAPVSNTNLTSQHKLAEEPFFSINNDEATAPTATRPYSAFFNSNNNNTTNTNLMAYSKSDFDVFNTSQLQNDDFFSYNNNNSSSNHTMNSTNSQSNTNKSYSQSVDNIRDMEIISDTNGSNKQNELYDFHYNASNATISSTMPFTNHYAYKGATGNNNSIGNRYTTVQQNDLIDSEFAASYRNALSASLAETPGVKFATLTPAANEPYIDPANGTLFSYGFFDGNVSATPSATNVNCKVENNNNNNMPWVKPEAAASNPFLS